MEELRLLAKTYYENTISVRFFGWRGGIFLTLSAVLFSIAAYLQLVLEYVNVSIVPMLIAGLLGGIARRQYDRNLICHLSYYTHLDSDNVSFHKAVYLQSLVSHVADTLFEAMKNLKEIRETSKSEHGLYSQGEWARFLKFLYDPESKNRILSLLIYLISLVALLTVSKSQTDVDFYNLINQLSYGYVSNYLIISVISIVSLYVFITVPVVFAYKYALIPFMLKTSSSDTLSKFFISELNKYACLEQRINSSC